MYLIKYLFAILNFFLVFVISCFVSQAATLADRVQRKDVIGKCFVTMSQETPDFKVEVSLCFEKDSLNRVEFAHAKMPDGSWLIDGVSDGWSEWHIKDGRLFLREEKGDPFDYCMMHLNGKVLTFEKCVREIKLISSHIWHLEEK